MTVSMADDGSTLLTGPAVRGLLEAAVEHAGGSLVSWRLDHVDANPRRSTTATYAAMVDWPTGRREELLGASTRVGGRSGNDDRAMVFGDGDREVAVWLYPDDPDLPGLRRASAPAEVAAIMAEHQVLPQRPEPDQLRLEMISYRPRRRAVIKVGVATSAGPRTFFLKVLRESSLGPTLDRHRLLLAAGIPVPVVLAATADCCVVLQEVPGRPLAYAIFDEAMPCTRREHDHAAGCVAARGRRPAAAAAVDRRGRRVRRDGRRRAARRRPAARLADRSDHVGAGRRRPGHRADPRRLPRGTAVRRGRRDHRGARRGHCRPRSAGRRPGLPAGPSLTRCSG